MLGVGYVILLWHSLSLPYNYLAPVENRYTFCKIPVAFPLMILKENALFLIKYDNSLDF